MISNVYRFNYNSDLNRLEFPENDPIPEDLQKIILPYRFLLENESFELLRLCYVDQKVVIQKYTQPCLCYKGTFYYLTIRLF